MRKSNIRSVGERGLSPLLCRFWDSPVYLVITGLLVAAGNLYGLEIIVYSYFVLTGILVSLFAKDSKPILVLWVLGYVTVSKQNNPGYYVEGSDTVSVFYDPNFRSYLILLVILIVLLHVLLFVKAFRRAKPTAPRFLLSLLLLGAAFCVGGIGKDYSYPRSALFGLIEFLSLAVPYLIFFFTLDREKLTYEDYAKVFTTLGCVLVIETVGMYSGLPYDKIRRYDLFTGWGIYNNVAGMLMMAIPAPLLFLKKRARVLPCFLLSSLFYLATVFTQSRNGMLIGGFIYLVSILAIRDQLPERKKRRRLTLYFLLFAAAICAPILSDAEFFHKIFDNLAKADDGTSRLNIYETGIRQFIENPWFGNGFYRADFYQWGKLESGSFLPPRFHNTVVQVLSSCGAFGIAAYLVHRVNTFAVCKKNPCEDVVFPMISILALLLSSLLDCFFFNFGPGLSYGILLVFLETGAASPRRKKHH